MSGNQVFFSSIEESLASARSGDKSEFLKKKQTIENYRGELKQKIDALSYSRNAKKGEVEAFDKFLAGLDSALRVLSFLEKKYADS